MLFSLRKMALAGAMGASGLLLSACEPGSWSTGVSVGTGVYYDSMLWNDYYYGGYRPPYYPPDRPERPDRPDRPERPDRPDRPKPPIAKPPSVKPPVARPLPARPPIHRPAGGPRRR